ncbi:hypothetical protein [Affinirhizobium pseudoryzae]|uniref:hypothetical protein n=1 Tax=Allorhizobium pseudoryzae TaxID=379684 RepID=UPI0013E9BC79|nr:hypothetical protein [Allorhizobium pseudoryzae]
MATPPRDRHRIQTEAEYQSALTAVRPYFESEPDAGTPEAADFDALVLLIEQYENRHLAF